MEAKRLLHFFPLEEFGYWKHQTVVGTFSGRARPAPSWSIGGALVIQDSGNAVGTLGPNLAPLVGNSARGRNGKSARMLAIGVECIPMVGTMAFGRGIHSSRGQRGSELRPLRGLWNL